MTSLWFAFKRFYPKKKLCNTTLLLILRPKSSSGSDIIIDYDKTKKFTALCVEYYSILLANNILITLL